MLNIYISIRSDGFPYEKLKKKFDSIANDFIERNKQYKDQITIIQSLFNDYVPGESNPIEYLGKSVETMKNADIVLMPLDYNKSMGCKCEKYIAQTYGIPMRSYLYTEEKTFFLADFIETYTVEYK